MNQRMRPDGTVEQLPALEESDEVVALRARLEFAEAAMTSETAKRLADDSAHADLVRRYRDMVEVVGDANDERDGERMRANACEARAETAEKQVETLRFELENMISYLGHLDQDADHFWMVKRMRAALADTAPTGKEKL